LKSYLATGAKMTKRKVGDYYVLEENNVAQLAQYVRRHLHAGYELVGGICVTYDPTSNEHIYLQAIIKCLEQDDPKPLTSVYNFNFRSAGELFDYLNAEFKKIPLSISDPGDSACFKRAVIVCNKQIEISKYITLTNLGLSYGFFNDKLKIECKDLQQLCKLAIEICSKA
jgi:hypothetical protein